jgi:ELWxxDGT repeat protein
MNPYLVADINQQGQQPGQPNPFSDSSPDSFIDVNGTIYFRADNGVNGRELWKIDPTTGNAVQFEINPGSNGASINDLTIFNNTLYFTVDRSGVDRNGLWKIGANGNPERVLASNAIFTQEGASFLLAFNGSLYFSGLQGRGLINKIDSSGTVTVLPFLPLQSDPALNLGGTPTSLSQLAVVGNTIFFGVPTLQQSGFGRQEGLWKLNASGTGLEAVQLYADGSVTPQQLTNVNGTLYFVKDTVINGVSYPNRDLWKSDGTTSGTVEIGLTGSNPNSLLNPNINNLINVGGTLYFKATSAATGEELWRINAGGSPEALDILPGSASSNLRNLTNINGTLYFVAGTGVAGSDQLWKVSGANGTPTLINGTNGAAQQPQVVSTINVNGDLYFTSQYDASFRDRHLTLWKVDGATNTPTFLSDVAENTYAGSNITTPGNLAYSNGKLYFSANSFREGQELWAYNLTKQPTRNDFNGDKKSDILWRNDDGSVAIWQMDGTNVLSSGLIPIPPAADSWKIAGTGDFNGDAKSDIVWRNDNDSVAIWQMDGLSVASSGLIASPPAASSWKIAGTGDFNGDAKSDIVWRNDNGSVAIWQMDGLAAPSTGLTSIPLADASWKIAGTGDFNGDGQSDILWRNDNGSVAIWQMNGLSVASSGLISSPPAASSWKIAGTGDFNNDQKSDILWRNDDGRVAIWQMDGINVLSADLTSISSRDNSWKIAQTDDFNGDNKSDILWRNDIGSVEIWQMDGNNVLASSGATSIPLADTSWKIAGPIL